MSVDVTENERITNLHLIKDYRNPLKAIAFSLTPNGMMRIVTVYPPHEDPNKFISGPIPRLLPYTIHDDLYLRFKNNDPHFRKKVVIKLRRYNTLADTLSYWIMPHKELQLRIPKEYLLDKGILTAEKFTIVIITGRHVDKYTAYIPHCDF